MHQCNRLANHVMHCFVDWLVYLLCTVFWNSPRLHTPPQVCNSSYHVSYALRTCSYDIWLIH